MSVAYVHNRCWYEHSMILHLQIDSEEDTDTELETEVIYATPVGGDDISKHVEVTTNTLRDNLVIRYWTGEQETNLHTGTDLAHNW